MRRIGIESDGWRSNVEIYSDVDDLLNLYSFVKNTHKVRGDGIHVSRYNRKNIELKVFCCEKRRIRFIPEQGVKSDYFAVVLEVSCNHGSFSIPCEDCEFRSPCEVEGFEVVLEEEGLGVRQI